MFGIYRIGAAVPTLSLGDPFYNKQEIVRLYKMAAADQISAVVFPELCLSGYTLSDLFFQENLYMAQNRALELLLEETRSIDTVAALGLMLRRDDRLYNVAVVIQRGEILGIVPKSYIPNKREYYEKRYFNSGLEIRQETVRFLGREIPFGVDLLFDDNEEFLMGVELCEDLWAITPPSNDMAANGANVILNLSASDELVGKASYRRELVRTQSARLICAYAYASSGLGESSADMVFSGDCMIAEYGSILTHGERFSFDSQLISADIDLQKISGLRRSETSFLDAPRKQFRRINIASLPRPKEPRPKIDPYPFVPSNKNERSQRCEEITAIQAYGLIRRMKHTRIHRAILGISGGLDSTLALLTTWKAFNIMQEDPSNIIAVTMPGFGTTDRTHKNAVILCNNLGVKLREIPIKNLAICEFDAIGHDSKIHDITFENVQARARTEILMNLANKENGIVIGTGDLSEIALGFSTYNGDHMSMYNINSGIPKTLVRYIVDYYAHIYPKIRKVLHDILDTPVSPELLPAKEDGEIEQRTEEIVGPYELHDFFLYHFVKYGAEPRKILFLASLAFGDRYDENILKRWLRLFLYRFFTQQFKRSCMPEGPKVGTISLSPRSDWRMPSDAVVKTWIDDLE